MWGELAGSLQHANGYVITILVLGFFGTMVFFERLIMYWRVFGVDFKKFLGNLKRMVAAEDIDRAISLCKNVSKTSLPGITLKALEAAETDPTNIKGTIEEETIDFLPKIEKRLGVLPAFTLIIMLVGVLGTIDSLWSAFHAVDVLDTAKKQASLAQGISSSLNPTALALIFSMGLMLGFHILKGLAVNLSERIHYGVTVLHNLLVPAETAQFVAVAAGAASAAPMPAAAMPEPEVAETATQSEDAFDDAAEDEDVGDDSFDDVSVEDIKDEEEII
jgi:biopolymer transport protein ExbB